MRSFAHQQTQPHKPASSSLARPTTQLLSQTNDEELKTGLSDLAAVGYGHDFSRIRADSQATAASRSDVRPVLAARWHLQRKAVVSSEEDVSEREADEVAEKVLRMNEPARKSPRQPSPSVEEIRQRTPVPLLQRQVDSNDPVERRRRGLPLPYREATRFIECMRTHSNRQHCEQTVLGIPRPPPTVPAWARGPWHDTDDRGRPRERQTPPGYGLNRLWYDPHVPVVTPGTPVPSDLPTGTRGTHDGLRWAYYGNEINVQQRIPWNQLAITFAQAQELDRNERANGGRLRRVPLRSGSATQDTDATSVESQNNIVQIHGFDRQGVIVGDPGWLHNNPGELRGGARSRGDNARERFADALGVGESNSVVFRSPGAGQQAIRQAIRAGGSENLVRRMCRWDDPHGQCNPWDLDPSVPTPPGVRRRTPAYVGPAQRILDRHRRPRSTPCDTLPPEVVDEMADFVARNETPGHGHVYHRGDRNLPPWVREIFERSPPPPIAEP